MNNIFVGIFRKHTIQKENKKINPEKKEITTLESYWRLSRKAENRERDDYAKVDRNRSTYNQENEDTKNQVNQQKKKACNRQTKDTDTKD